MAWRGTAAASRTPRPRPVRLRCNRGVRPRPDRFGKSARDPQQRSPRWAAVSDPTVEPAIARRRDAVRWQPGTFGQRQPHGRLNAIADDSKGDDVAPQIAAMAEADRAWMVDTLLALLQTPSPSGRTDAVMQLIGDILDDFGVPFSLTRRGALMAELPGESSSTDRAVVVHSDT